MELLTRNAADDPRMIIPVKRKRRFTLRIGMVGTPIDLLLENVDGN